MDKFIYVYFTENRKIKDGYENNNIKIIFVFRKILFYNLNT